MKYAISPQTCHMRAVHSQSGGYLLEPLLFHRPLCLHTPPVHVSSVATTVFRGKFFQIPRASLPISAAHRGKFTHIVINFLSPLNPTKYAVFVAGNCN